MTTEIWKHLVIDGKIHDWYSVSNLGNVVSHIRRTAGGNIADPSYSRKIKCFNRSRDNVYARVDIYYPLDFFDGDWVYNSRSKTTCKRTEDVHRLVMQAHRPMDEYAPDRLASEWNQVITADMIGQPRIPDSYKSWISGNVVVNHIDHDATNNCVDNLEYTTQKENIQAAVKFYGGNVTNKSKQVDPIVIHDGRYNPVIQEWEDTQIEFVGKEGERLHGMLLELAEAREQDPGETFVDILKEFVKTEEME